MADVITRLKLESSEYDSKIKRATQGLLQMEQECRKVGGTLAVLEKDQLDFVRGLGNMETVSRSARGKVSELTSAFTELRVQYKHLSDEEKKGDYGKALSASLEQLKNRINEAKTDLAEVDNELKGASASTGEWSGVLNQLGGQLGINNNLLNIVTTGTIATTAAVAAGVTATIAATKAWSEYNAELQKQGQVVVTTTGLKGGDAEKLQDGLMALVKVYDVDFREAVNAANTLIHQFGVSGDEALNLLKDGLQGMIQGDGGKLLSMIQQYAPSFRDAGIEASQLVAIIQNSEGGLFTDQNMNAIVMGIRNIRHQTKATQEALSGLGIDGEEMSRKLNDGSMTVFEALQKVAGAIDNVGSGSDAAGAIMQNVFGRQGTMAGTKLGEAIATLNTNLAETKTQTGELGESLANLANQNEKLNQALRDTFGYDGWQSMANGIQSSLVGALANVLSVTNDIRQSFFDISGIDVFSTIISSATRALGPLGSVLDTLRKIAGIGKLKGDDGDFANSNEAVGASVGSLLGGGTSPEVVVTTGNGGGGGNSNNNNNSGGGKKKESWTPITMQDAEGLTFGRSVNDVSKEMQRAQAQYNAAGDEMGRSMAKAMIDALKAEKDTMLNEGDVTKGGYADAYTHDFSKDIKKLNTKPADDLAKQGKEVQESWREAAGAIGSVGNALAGLDDPSARIVGTVGQAIAQIALGFAQATAADSKLGVFGWIAAVAGGLGTMLSTISAIHSATGYAEGGIVNYNGGGGVIPGNSYSGDKLRMIGVNSGEIIMNTAQQNNVANALLSRQGGGMIEAQPYTTGELMFLGLNNTTRRQGKGEIVTTSMLKARGLW